VVLIVALTCPDQERPTTGQSTTKQDELGRALARFAQLRADVDTVSSRR
jgi:hypothetical protein